MNEKKEIKFWQGKSKSMKRFGTIALATTIALSVPSISNVVSEATPFKDLQVSVAHAQSENLMNVTEALTTFHINHSDDYEHWTHAYHNSGDVPVDSPEFDISNLTYVVKFPDELAHLLDDEYVLDYLFGEVTNFGTAQNSFMITGYVVDENGEMISINKDGHEPYKYISVNKETNSIEFDFNSFYNSNNLAPYYRQDVNGQYFLNELGFQTPIVVPDSRILNNGTYEFKSAIVQGKSIDLDNVSNAYSENLIVDYSTDPVPDPDPEPEVDTAELEALVNEANSYDAEDYTEETFDALTEAISSAEAVLANEDATQDDVDAAVAELQSAIDGLEEVDGSTPDPEPEPEVDTAELEALVNEANSYDAEDYTEETFDALTEAISSAEAVLANEEATQDDVDAAVAELQSAIDGLEEVEGETPKPEPKPEPEVDTGELEALVEKAKDYNSKDYTKKTFSSLTDALEEAEGVLNNEEATQKEVNTALENLQTAINNLVKAETVVIIEDDEKDVEENAKEDKDGERLPDTATNNYMFMLLGSVFAFIGGVVLYIRRRLV